MSDMIPVNNTEIGMVINEVLSPVLKTMAQFMAQNTEALERLATQQKLQSDRMEALEKQIRLNTLVTPTQVKYINDAIKRHAREILSKKGLEDDKPCVKKLSAAIRKSITARFGIAALHEVPKHEYSTVMTQVETWNDLLTVRDIVRGAREVQE